MLGPVGGSLISIAIFISTFGVVGIYTLTAPRIYYAMAADGVFFRKVAEIHPRYQTPAFAIIFQSLWAAVLILFWGTFENLISYVVFTDWISSRSRRERHRAAAHDAGCPAAVPRAGLPVGAAVLRGHVRLVRRHDARVQTRTGLGGLLFLGLGVPVYYAWKRRGARTAPRTDDMSTAAHPNLAVARAVLNGNAKAAAALTADALAAGLPRRSSSTRR